MRSKTMKRILGIMLSALMAVSSVVISADTVFAEENNGTLSVEASEATSSELLSDLELNELLAYLDEGAIDEIFSRGRIESLHDIGLETMTEHAISPLSLDSRFRNISSSNISNPSLFLRDVLTMPIQTGSFLGIPVRNPLHWLWYQLGLTLAADYENFSRIYTSGLVMANNLSSARTMAIAEINNADELTPNQRTRFRSIANEHEHFTQAQINSASSPVFFRTDIIAGPRNGNFPSNWNQEVIFLTTYFYDFELIPLHDAAAADVISNNIGSAVVDSAQINRNFTTVTQNRMPSGLVPVSQTIGTTTNTVVTNHSSNTTGHSFAQTVGTETKDSYSYCHLSMQ